MADDEAKIVERHIRSFFDDGDGPVEEQFARRVEDAMRSQGTKDPRVAISRLVEGGTFLIASDDMYHFLQYELGEDTTYEPYKRVMARYGADYYRRIKSRPKAGKSPIYSDADWTRDRTFSAKPGQLVTREIYDYMLNVLPPKDVPQDLLDHYGCYRGFLSGEAFGETPDGRLTYMAFGERPDGMCVYLGLSPTARSASANRRSSKKPKVASNSRKAEGYRPRDSKGRFKKDGFKRRG